MGGRWVGGVASSPGILLHPAAPCLITAPPTVPTGDEASSGGGGSVHEPISCKADFAYILPESEKGY